MIPLEGSVLIQHTTTLRVVCHRVRFVTGHDAILGFMAQYCLVDSFGLCCLDLSELG